MSDLSFLDGKYARFAKVVENYEVTKRSQTHHRGR